MRRKCAHCAGLRIVGGCLLAVFMLGGLAFAQQSPSAEAPAEDDISDSLVDAPWMLGDFFGRRATQVTVGQLYGQAVHHTVASGSAFAGDDLHVIDLNAFSPKVTWVGGPAGLVPGSFLTPSKAPPLEDVERGLSLNGVPGDYTAVLTDELTDVYDNPANLTPDVSNAPVYNVFELTTLELPGPNVADIVGRVRLQDNHSALPVDRVFFDYNYFHNAILTSNGVDVNRFEPGIEKTFWEGLTSIEVRVPMAMTLNSRTEVDGALDTFNYELGNAAIIPKVLLYLDDSLAVAAGLGVAIPTADDLLVVDSNRTQLLKVSNDSVHLIPYLSMLYAPRGSDWYSHSFLGIDVDTNGATVSANTEGDGLNMIGVWNDQHLLSFSTSIGVWMYRSGSWQDFLQGVAPTAELHYTAAVNDADNIESGAFIIGNSQRDLSLLNGTAGVNFALREAVATFGYSFPITSDDRVFDGQFRAFINRFY